MLRGNSKSLGNHVVSPEEKERLQWEGFTETLHYAYVRKRTPDLLSSSPKFSFGALAETGEILDKKAC